MITIAEYVEAKQPEIAQELYRWIRHAKALSLSFSHWEAIMREPSLPGRGGLLEGEKAV
jgi:hypothetical protein